MHHYYLKNFGCMAVGVLLCFAAGYLLAQLESPIVQRLVTPSTGTDVEWANKYVACGYFVAMATAFLALVWHSIALLDTGRDADLRRLWILLGAAAVAIGLAVAIVLFPNAQSGLVFAQAACVFNVVAAYWLGTVFWTPSTHKYDPLGAPAMRGRLPL